jgi:hypothetical protein
MNELSDTIAAAAQQIRAKVKMVAADETTFGVLSAGERITVALVLERHDLLQLAWGPVLESIDRLGAGLDRRGPSRAASRLVLAQRASSTAIASLSSATHGSDIPWSVPTANPPGIIRGENTVF